MRPSRLALFAVAVVALAASAQPVRTGVAVPDRADALTDGLGGPGGREGDEDDGERREADGAHGGWRDGRRANGPRVGVVPTPRAGR